MTDTEDSVLEFAKHAAKDRFRSIALRTELLTPDVAAAVLRSLPDEEGFEPQQIAAHLDNLPEETGQNVRIGKSAAQAFVAVAVPRDPERAFRWAQDLMASTLATSVKMNFGPDKPTDINPIRLGKAALASTRDQVGL